jgi:hypothetical protein
VPLTAYPIVNAAPVPVRLTVNTPVPVKLFSATLGVVAATVTTGELDTVTGLLVASRPNPSLANILNSYVPIVDGIPYAHDPDALAVDGDCEQLTYIQL